MKNSGIPFFHRRQVVPFIFLTPFLVLFLVFKVWPVIYAFLLSFQKLQGIGTAEWIGVHNYQTLFSDPAFGKSLYNTTLYTVGTLLILIPIPLILAALLHSGRVKWAHGFRLLLFLPVLTSLVVTSVVFRLILAEEGIFNSALSFFGVPPQRWLLTAALAIPSMIIIAVWRWTGMNIIYFTSGLGNIPKEVFEAAAIDGANALQSFFYMTVPMLKPIIIFVVILSLIGGYQVFVEPYVLYVGGRTPGEGGLTMAMYLYRTGFRTFKMGYASAIGVALALIIMVLSLIQFRSLGFFGREE